MTNIKIYQICHNFITYFVTLTSPKKVNRDLYLGSEGVYVKHISDSSNSQFCPFSSWDPIFLL